jgi:hypothetical protein
MNEFSNGLTPAQAELLAILAEERSEVTKVAQSRYTHHQLGRDE